MRPGNFHPSCAVHAVGMALRYAVGDTYGTAESERAAARRPAGRRRQHGLARSISLIFWLDKLVPPFLFSSTQTPSYLISLVREGRARFYRPFAFRNTGTLLLFYGKARHACINSCFSEHRNPAGNVAEKKSLFAG